MRWLRAIESHEIPRVSSRPNGCNAGSMDIAAFDRTSYLIIQAAIEIHKVLGPGLLESAYRTCMMYELQARNLNVQSELIVPVRYKHLVLDGGYRLDLLVEDAIIVELKAVENVLPVHQAQVRSYLRLTDKRLGLLINFNVGTLVTGVDRIVNKFGMRSADCAPKAPQ